MSFFLDFFGGAISIGANGVSEAEGIGATDIDEMEAGSEKKPGVLL
jgi:hypothetical protein